MPTNPTPARTPYCHKIRYGITGAPILDGDDMDGSHAPGVGLAPDLIELVYSPARDGKPASVAASVTGTWTRFGEREPSHARMTTHFKDGPEDWPAWLAEEARLHDPDAASAVVSSPPATDRATVRDRIRRVLAQSDGFDFDSLEPHDYQIQAAAILAALPPDTERLHDQILTLQADLAKMRDLLRTENQRANAAISREETAEQAALEAAATARAAALRDAVEICDEAGAVYTSQALKEHAAGAYALMERFQRKAGEAEETAARTATTPPAAWVDGHPQLEAIASAVYERCETGDGGIVHDDPRNIAVAVLAVLPPPADRAAVLLEVADWLKARRPEFFERWAVVEQDRYEGGVEDAAAELRRMADEAQQSEPGRSDVGTEFVRQVDQPDEARLAAFETDLAEAQPEPIVTVHAAPDLSPAAAEALSALAEVAKQQIVCDFDHPHPAYPCGRRLTDAAVGARQPDTETQASPANRRALVHNAITDALSAAGDWVPLSIRIAATRAALAEVDAWHADDPAMSEQAAGGAGGVADETGEGTQPDINSGPGWYEVINPRNATTNIALVHEDGSLYLPEGDDLTADEFAFAAARGNAHRLVRADDEEPRP